MELVLDGTENSAEYPEEIYYHNFSLMNGSFFSNLLGSNMHDVYFGNYDRKYTKPSLVLGLGYFADYLP